MSEEKLVPKLRFSGDEKYSRTTLENIAKVTGGKRMPKGSSLVSEPNNHPYITVSNMNNNFEDLSTYQYVPIEIYPQIKNYIVDYNDLIISVAGTLGLVKKVPKCLDKANLTENANRISEIKIDVDFLQYYLNTSMIQNRILAVQTNNAQPKLALKEIRNFKINYPSIEEQKKVSRFLSLIDKRINLLQNKHKLYKDFKKYLMQQIFAQKLRFDFHDDWEIKKLGEITQINTGKKDVKDKKDDGKYPFFVRSEKIERIDSYSFDGEAILIPGDGKIGEVYHYINGKFDYHQRVYKISDFHNDVFGKYIYYYLEKNFLRQAMKNTAKATVDSLRMDTLTKMPIELPSFEEQIKIANSLTFTDKKINLAKDNIDVANKFKKGLLQQMFV